MKKVDQLLNPIQSPVQEFDLQMHSHRRRNPLTGSYVLCSPHRSKRPWQGSYENNRRLSSTEYDPKCYLCPGNIRATGYFNPKYSTTHVFVNDYPAVSDDESSCLKAKACINNLKEKLLKTESVMGKSYVVCFSPKHGVTLPLMSSLEILSVVDAWCALYEDCRKDEKFTYLQIFENKGTVMGCSNPHPHGQAWCLDMIPTEVGLELENLNTYHEQHKTHMLSDYVKLELTERERIVAENDSFLVVVPYWAVWPYETLLVSKTHLRSLQDFSAKNKVDLATILKSITTKYDNLFRTSFPYTMGIHQAPFNCAESKKNLSWFHIHFYPPLLRSSSVKKFYAGFEMLAESQRDFTSEVAAARLSELSGEVHFLNKVMNE